MRIEQLYYTSAKRGIGNGSGFQVYSMSEGITKTEMSEIQNLVGYVPPTTLPSRPTEEEIDNLFPKSFTSFQLSTGRFGVFQSSYVGKDYSERYGNYFSHVLVFDSKLLPEYPIEYYQSPIFKERLTKEEENGTEAPQPLPTLGSVPVNPDLSFTKVVQFLNEGNRMEYFQSILSTFIANEVAGKRLMIIDDSKHLPYWYAAIQFSLPNYLAHDVTLTTYTHNPDKNPALICSTWTTGTRFTTAPANNHPYYLFDFQNQNIYSVEHVSLYANNAIAAWKQGESIQPLFSILQQSTITTIDKELDKAVAVLHLIEKGISLLDKGELADATEFVRRYGHDSLYMEVLNKLKEYWFDQGHWEEELLRLSMENAHSIALFLFEGALKTKKKEHMETAYTFFFDTVDQFILDAHLPEDVQKVTQYYDDIHTKHASSLNFSVRAISSDRLSKIGYLKTEPNPFKVRFYFTNFIDDLGKVRRGLESLNTSTQEQTVYMLFILMMKEDATNKQDVLEALYTDPDIFVDVVTRYYKDIIHTNSSLKMDLEDAFQSLSAKLKGNRDWSAVTLKSLAKTEIGKKLIIQGFSNELELTKQPVRLLENYYNDLFTSIPALDTELPKLVEMVLQHVKNRGDFQEQLPSLLTSTFTPYIRAVELQQVLDEYEEAIVFSNSNGEFLKTIKKLRDERKLRTKLNVIPLIEFTNQVKNGGQPEEGSKAVVGKILGAFSPEKYQEYLEWSLPAFFSPKFKEKDRKNVFEMLFIPDKVDLFWNTLANHPDITKKFHVDCLFAFLLVAFSKRRVESRVEVNRRLDANIVQYFQQNKSDFKKVNELMIQHPDYKNSLSIRERWENIKVNTLDKGNNSSSNRSLFSKIKNKLF
jgi:hypothetical protein